MELLELMCMWICMGNRLFKTEYNSLYFLCKPELKRQIVIRVCFFCLWFLVHCYFYVHRAMHLLYANVKKMFMGW